MRSADQVLTGAEMRAAEEALIAQGISVDLLMERAGEGAAEWVWRVAAGRPVTVLCGPGNNGGDGYVLAEALRARGGAVTVVAPLAPATDAARRARAQWQGEVSEQPTGGHGGVFVDCLFGTGLSRPLAPEHDALLATLVSHHDLTVAVDLPSGVGSNDGELLGAAPRCDVTLALGAYKRAHFLIPARALMGWVQLVPIGIGNVPGAAEVFARPRLPAPARDAHKYTRGYLGVIAGEMAGASLLACEAATRAGAGYVRLLSEDEPTPAAASLVVDPRPLPEPLADPRWSALLVGPGLGRSAQARERLGAVLERRVPTVIDADALHLLDSDVLEGIGTSHLLVTPHEGELAALCTTFDIQGEGKLARANALAEVTGLTVLAKGPDTVLCGPDGRIAFFPAASPWLSTAGTGDVLAGIAASRLATSGDPYDAAGEAVWLHRAAAQTAGAAFTADDLAHSVSKAYARFL